MLTPVLTASVIAWFGPAFGQDAAGKKLLEGWRGFDAKLAKTYHLGFYLGRKNMGQVTFVVSKAPPSTGATYRSEVALTVTFGKQRLEGKEVQLLDEKLALLSRTETETERTGAAAKTKSSTIRKVAGEWVYTAKRGGESATARTLDAGSDHWESGVFLARKVPRAAATYTLRGVDWPSWKELQRPGGPVVEYEDMTVTVPAAKPYRHRGKTVQAHVIQIARPGLSKLAVVVDGQGELLAMWEIGGPPIKFVVGTAAECKQDLPAPKSTGPVPADAVMVYFKVLYKKLPVDDLDKVMDWAAVRDDLGRGDVTVEAFATELKERVKTSPLPPSPEVLGYLRSMLTTRTKGSSARVELSKQVFKLRRAADGAWKITRIPR